MTTIYSRDPEDIEILAFSPSYIPERNIIATCCIGCIPDDMQKEDGTISLVVMEIGKYSPTAQVNLNEFEIDLLIKGLMDARIRLQKAKKSGQRVNFLYRNV